MRSKDFLIFLRFVNDTTFTGFVKQLKNYFDFNYLQYSAGQARFG